jgi:hypothetical protein
MPTLAPLPLPAAPLAPPVPRSSIEYLIGDVVAIAAMAILKAANEFQHAGKCSGRQAGGWLALLLKIRQDTLGRIDDFESTAKVYGRQALRARFGDNVPDAMIDEVASWPLQILAQAVRAAMN